MHASHLFCVAPMMEWTDRHDRYFLRLISRHARLYTEMIATQALLRGERAKLLRFDPAEQPVALQLGGCIAGDLARCAEFGEREGYAEINLNCGCPSDKVQDGGFGACLMREPRRVAAGIAAMRAATRLPVTVKCRIGVDDSEEYPFLKHFVETVAAAGCDTFIVHARKAWLKGLSPKENREIPPLTYETVYRLKRDLPQLTVVINGGIRTLEECDRHLKHVDGVMMGREVYENPWILADVDRRWFGGAAPGDRASVLRRFVPYAARERAAGTPLAQMTRHLLGLYRGQHGGRAFRRLLTEQACRPGTGLDIFEQALAAVETQLQAVA
ncbi:MAG TPA: tRNA dihydrouridine(20/20a) synthase DusA [Candidatus Binatia bacterium]|nr:tRNA dihydrouridine(20/20a) synthase DusA [Candidatus Binatia bacterium]